MAAFFLIFGLVQELTREKQRFSTKTKKKIGGTKNVSKN
jgi:hypothetical protein